jgi:predicted MFS family arabinose efflux permease
MALSRGPAGGSARVNPAAKFRAACYTIEGINSFAAVIYFNYLYFYFRDRFGFNDQQNLLLAALMGLVYMVAAWQAGQFAQRRGYFTALKAGFGILAAALAAGLIAAWQWHVAGVEIAIACVANVGVCFIWPTLEALVTEGGTPKQVAGAVGIYNVTWAVTNALAFFIGGTIIKTLGYESMFSLPLAMVVIQFLMVFWLEKIYPGRTEAAAAPAPVDRPPDAARRRARNFQHMAWVANPCAYVAINTLVALLPGIAAKFQLSTMLAGFLLSLWCFVRLFMFIALWHWPAWHYRFRWLVTSFVLLIASFAVVLVAPSLAVVLAAQVIFGGSIGLLYYSSLFYALDASEAKGEHGGIHEAAIGAGNCLGPGLGAAALWLVPQFASGGAWAVSGLLVLGLGGMLAIRNRGRNQPGAK